MKRNERTKKMMRNFIKDHEAGMSIKDIAAKYHLDVSTVYKKLDEIAAKAGVSRDSLLKVVQAPHYTPSTIHAKTPVLPEGEFRANVATAMEAIEKVQEGIRTELERIESISEQNKGGISA